MQDRKSGYDDDVQELNEAQMNEASEIFGAGYMDFIQEDSDEEEDEAQLMGKNKFRERGVGVSYGVDSEEEIISSDEEDDDLFGDEDDEDGSGGQQKAEALRLKREKKRLAKEERR
jgi:hypothetical protein